MDEISLANVAEFAIYWALGTVLYCADCWTGSVDTSIAHQVAIWIALKAETTNT